MVLFSLTLFTSDEIDEEDVANQQSPNGVENFINPTVLL